MGSCDSSRWYLREAGWVRGEGLAFRGSPHPQHLCASEDFLQFLIVCLFVTGQAGRPASGSRVLGFNVSITSSTWTLNCLCAPGPENSLCTASVPTVASCRSVHSCTDRGKKCPRHFLLPKPVAKTGC